jgi:prepilin-type processing-associated H-X9-DG protein
MVDWPGTYHNGAAGFAFGDGHSEIQKWHDARTVKLVGQGRSQTGNQDIWWMSVHSTGLIAGPSF